MRHILLGLGAALLLSACGDPLRDVARLSDVSTSDASTAVAASPGEARTTGGGLFGRLLNRQTDDPTNAAVDAALADANVDTGSADPIILQTQTQPERGGLFGWFRPAQSTLTAQPTLEAQVLDNPTPTEVVAIAVPQAIPERPRRGLAGLFRRSPDSSLPSGSGPDGRDVPAGAVMPFGAIGRVCGLRTNELGTQVDAAAGYRIYDTIPNSTAPRPFYVTGFDDNCARTFTGAVVVTGDVETHEFVRYQGSNERIAYTTTDNAYEALKASICRVGRGQPCGARTDRLNRNTQFITVYNFFGGTFSAVPTKWAQILVHDGQLLAMSIKDGG